MSYAVYLVARHYEGEEETLPFFATDAWLASIIALFEGNDTLRQKYMQLYEHRAKIAELQGKRDFMRTRGYKVEEYRLNEIDLEIGQAVYDEQKIHKDYEMIRRLWAYEVDGLKL